MLPSESSPPCGPPSSSGFSQTLLEMRDFCPKINRFMLWKDCAAIRWSSRTTASNGISSERLFSISRSGCFASFSFACPCVAAPSPRYAFLPSCPQHMCGYKLTGMQFSPIVLVGLGFNVYQANLFLIAVGGIHGFFGLAATYTCSRYRNVRCIVCIFVCSLRFVRSFQRHPFISPCLPGIVA